MYSGTTLRNGSGNIVGVHQRIDRVARRKITNSTSGKRFFPSIKTILHFEGNNGPDGIKRKSPSVDEPWHYIDPDNTSDGDLLNIIDNHLKNLINALSTKDEAKSGFEAAWLAHAITDGLTPPHHFPLAEKIHELWGKSHTERLTTKDKIIIKGKTKRSTLLKNWEYWGAKGVFSLHFSFELGVASAIALHKFEKKHLPIEARRQIKQHGYMEYFIEAVKKVDDMALYEEFDRTGWTIRLARKVRKQLVPIIIDSVSLAWCYASDQAKKG